MFTTGYCFTTNTPVHASSQYINFNILVNSNINAIRKILILFFQKINKKIYL